MSWTASKYVRELEGERSKAGRGDKLVMFALADLLNEGVAWPSQQSLARDTRYSVGGLRKILLRLEAKGLIARVIGNGRKNPTRYTFPGMESEQEAKGAAAPTKVSLISSTFTERPSAFQEGKGATNAGHRKVPLASAYKPPIEPPLLKSRVSYFGALPGNTNHPPMEKAKQKDPLARVPVLASQRLQKARGLHEKALGLPDAELRKLASEIGELGLVRRSGLKPLDAARCLVEAARSQVPDATGGGIYAAALEASRLPEGYQVREPMRWLMRRVRDRFHAVALYPRGVG